MSLAAFAEANAIDDMRSSTVSCDDLSHCPSAIGSFVSVWSRDRGSYFCTASLVAPDLALLSGHCLDPDLRISGASCRGSAMVILPEYLQTDPNGVSHRVPMERLECSSVITVVDPEMQNFVQARDYALIRLAHASSRAPLEISREGFDQGFRPTVYYVHDTTTSGPWRGGIRMLTHGVAQLETFYQPYATNALSPVAVLAGGDLVREGASGGPVLDASGHIRGTINGRQASHRVDGVDYTVEYTPSELIGRFAIQTARGANFATNLGCLLPLSERLLPRTDGSCGVSNASIATGYIQERRVMARRALDERDRLIATAHSELRDLAMSAHQGQWDTAEYTSSIGVTRVVPQPRCRPARSRRAVTVTVRSVISQVDGSWSPSTRTLDGTQRVRYGSRIPECATAEPSGTLSSQ